MAKQTTFKEHHNVLVYRKRLHFNIGILLFGIIFLYLIVLVFLYLTTNRTTAYEVRRGSILNDTAYTGLAIREETLVKASEAGYVNYYSTEHTKVKVGTKIYATSGSEIRPPVSAASDETEKKQLTEDQQNSLGMLVRSFHDSFSENMFSDVYAFKDTVANSVSNISSLNKAAYLDQLLSEGNGLALSRSADDGITVYSSDGYETLTPEAVTAASFDRTNYKCSEFYNNMKVAAGDPVYKLVTSENWSVVIPVSDEMADTLKEKKSVRVRFRKDKETLTAGLQTAQKDGQSFAYLNFSGSMIRYAGDRFLELELILEDAFGLKIPKSALTQKAFYVVPAEYINPGGNSREKGVLRRHKKKDGSTVTEFLPVTVYYTEDNLAYLDPAAVSAGDILLKQDSNVTYVVKEQRKLNGVFSINKGYAVFKQIRILCESDDYYIVETGNDYGISNYDHIALNSKNVKENDIIHQ